MRQGKCLRCKKAFRWQRPIPLQKVRCPDCGGRLKRTSHRLRKFPWEELLWLQ